ncbi:ATP-binding cassette domain-containing protein [Nocardia sp. NPDC019219]|uniref:ATP-binding cassette domain-containing protein n=1 Tax=Nocardia sp. NPDC019219 TaxID=3154590 RepID=UPI0033C5523D
MNAHVVEHESRTGAAHGVRHDLVAVAGLTVLGPDGRELAGPATFRIPAGTVTALTGPSGSGKTTVMRALLGQLPSATARATGSVSVAGHDVFALDRAALHRFRRRHIAYVGQDPGSALNPLLRVRALLREVAPRAPESTLTDTLALVGLSPDYLRRRPGELSGGQQRRVALARALIRRTGVLVLDEPLAGLHGALRTDIAGQLAALARERSAAILLSGHDTALVHSIADDIVELGAILPASIHPVRVSGSPGKSSVEPEHPVRANGLPGKRSAESEHPVRMSGSPGKSSGVAGAESEHSVEASGLPGKSSGVAAEQERSVQVSGLPGRSSGVAGAESEHAVRVDGSLGQSSGAAVEPRYQVQGNGSPERTFGASAEPGTRPLSATSADPAASRTIADVPTAGEPAEPVAAASGARQSRPDFDRARNGSAGSLPAADDRPQGDVVLRAAGISASIDGHRVLTDIDLALAAGSALAVVGASGAGKTTLARVIAGLHASATGALELGGTPITVGANRRIRYGAGGIQLVTQNPRSALNPRRTVAQTLGRPLRRIGRVARRDLARRITELLAAVELSADLAARYPHELSGGQRQRVALARALAAEPAVLLCDEITSALDHHTAAAIMALLDRIRTERGTALLIITHDMALVAEYCPTLLVLDQGRIVETGDTETVLAAPTHNATSELLV